MAANFNLVSTKKMEQLEQEAEARMLVSQDEGYLKTIAKRFMRNKVAMGGLFVFGLVILMAIFAPLIVNYSPYETTGFFETAPNSDFLLGTDEVGRDVFSRLIYGARVSLIVGLGSVAIYIAIGTTLGLISGYFGGMTDAFIMRLTEVFMSFPYFMVILVLVSLVGPSIWTVTIVLGLLGWPTVCRLVRGSVLSIKDTDFIQAAVSVGYSTPHILFKQILPNVLSPIFG